MRTMLLVCLLIAGCATDSSTNGVGEVTQNAVSGTFTVTIPPNRFPMNPLGVLDAGPQDIVPGSLWLSASVTLHCSTATYVSVCGREYDPSTPTTATTWCTVISQCAGDTTYNVPMTAFTADAHHVLAVSVQRAGNTATITNAVLTGFSFGD